MWNQTDTVIPANDATVIGYSPETKDNEEHIGLFSRRGNNWSVYCEVECTWLDCLPPTYWANKPKQ